MNSESKSQPHKGPIQPGSFADFDFANWTQELIHQGQKQGFIQLEELSFPIPNGPRLSDVKIEEVVETLNSAGVYVSQGVAPTMPSMGLIRVDSDGCLVSLSYTCTLKWIDLDATENPDVRHCLKCKRNVYHIKTGSDISIAVENGACVAFFK